MSIMYTVMMSHTKKLVLGFASILLLLFILGVVSLILFSSWLKTRHTYSVEILNNTPVFVDNDIVTPTPMPFYELTMPYLRSRTYESVLSDGVPLNSNSSYTSYLTSYQSDGLKIESLLTIPKSGDENKKYPAIVFVHGYIPPEEYKTQENYGAYVDYLARNGFVVLKIDLRGHGNSEGEAGGGYYSSDYIIDTLHAYNALSNASFVDSSQVYLWGHSMAGNVVLRSMTADTSIRKAVIWAGAGYTYEDLIAFGIEDTSYEPPREDSQRARKRALLRETHGTFSPESDFWKLVTPIPYIDSKTFGRLQIHHAVDDQVVTVDYARNLKRVLSEKDLEIDLKEYLNGGHNISGSSFSKAMQETVAFYNN